MGARGDAASTELGGLSLAQLKDKLNSSSLVQLQVCV
jgi:hypothetical protein